MLFVGCGDDAGGDDEQGSADASGSASATGSESTGADDEASVGEASVGSEGTSGTGSSSADGGTSSGAGESSGSGDDTAGIACGDASCGGDETCVNPCCGGPAPVCYPASPNGTCEGRDTPVPAEECQFGGCEAELCCDPAPCVARPPYCVASDRLSCTGNQCSVDTCQGELNGLGGLDCLCA